MAHEDLRPLLFGLAYRMVGSVSEAEDLVQEAYLRFELAGGEELGLESPRAWLSRVVTRLAIDHLRSARVRRETYPGEWLPEPLVGDAQEEIELADTLSQAFLVLLERLSPVERAVLLLKDVFELPFEEIAGVVGKSEANCRQLAVRARRHVEAERPRFEASRERREALAERFFAACEEGDLDALTELLAADVVLHGDGGGKAPALAQPLHGRERAVKFLAAISRFEVEFRRVAVNGQPGAMFLTRAGELVSVVALDIADGQVQAVRSVVNPENLAHLGPTADVRTVLREGRRR